MKVPYQRSNPNAGVLNYEIAEEAIILEFADRKFRYVYNAARPGATHVKAMQRLALAGKGLTTYVNQHVRENYAAKIRL